MKINKDLILNALTVSNILNIPQLNTLPSNSFNKATISLSKNTLYGNNGKTWIPLSADICNCNFMFDSINNVRYYNVCTERTDYSVAIIPQDQGSFTTQRFTLNTTTLNGMLLSLHNLPILTFSDNNYFYITSLKNLGPNRRMQNNEYIILENTNGFDLCSDNQYLNCINNFSNMNSIRNNTHLNILHDGDVDVNENEQLNLIANTNAVRFPSPFFLNKCLNIIGSIHRDYQLCENINILQNYYFSMFRSEYVNLVNCRTRSRNELNNNTIINIINAHSGKFPNMNNNTHVNLINLEIIGSDIESSMDSNQNSILKNIVSSTDLFQWNENLNHIVLNSGINEQNNRYTNTFNTDSIELNNHSIRRGTDINIQSNRKCIFINNAILDFRQNENTTIVHTDEIDSIQCNSCFFSGSGYNSLQNMSNSILLGNSFVNHSNSQNIVCLHTMNPIVTSIIPSSINRDIFNNITNSTILYKNISDSVTTYQNLTNFCGTLFQNNNFESNQYITSIHSKNVRTSLPNTSYLNLLNSNFDYDTQKEYTTLTNTIHLTKNIRYNVRTFKVSRFLNTFTITDSMHTLLFDCRAIDRNITITLPTLQNEGQYIKLLIYNIPQGSNFSAQLISSALIYDSNGSLSNGDSFNTLFLGNGSYELFFYTHWFILFR